MYVPAEDLVSSSVKGALAVKGIQCAVYSGKYSNDDNIHNFAHWREGKACVMVATSAFGMGIDYPSVRDVYLYGLSYTIEEYSQQCGQAVMRSLLQHVSCSTLNVKNTKLKNITVGVKEGFEGLLKYATMKEVCRRCQMSRYLDGTEVEWCSYFPCQRCDVCEWAATIDDFELPSDFFHRRTICRNPHVTCSSPCK